jgi:hypothetical protein
MAVSKRHLNFFPFELASVEYTFQAAVGDVNVRALDFHHAYWTDYRTYTWLVLPAVSRVPGSIALDPHPSSDPGAAFQENFRLAINSLGTLKAPPGVFIPGFSRSVAAS